MKIQHLSVIFIIIILPIAMILSVYVGNLIDVANQEKKYDTVLLDATYDAVRAYQMNSLNNDFSSETQSKERDVKASVNSFFNSLASGMQLKGYDKEYLSNYVPALLYTMYDGYYIYSLYNNSVNVDQNGKVIYQQDLASTTNPQGLISNEQDIRNESSNIQYGLKPYVYYSCEYADDDYDIVVNYTLDNYITVMGSYVENGQTKYISKSGFYIDARKIYIDDSKIDKGLDLPVVGQDGKVKCTPIILNKGKNNQVEIGPEILTEKLMTFDNDKKELSSQDPQLFRYILINGNKYYYDHNYNETKIREYELKYESFDGVPIFRLDRNVRIYINQDELKSVVARSLYCSKPEQALIKENFKDYNAFNYYYKAYNFSKPEGEVYKALSLIDIAPEEKGGKITYKNIKTESFNKEYSIDTNQGEASSAEKNTSHVKSEYVTNNIFDYKKPNNDPELESSAFNEHRMDVIISSIESNLLSEIASFNKYITSDYAFKMPALNEVEWYRIANNVSVTAFMQGVVVGNYKYYSNYAVVANTKNTEYINRESIYIQKLERPKGEEISTEPNIQDEYNEPKIQKEYHDPRCSEYNELLNSNKNSNDIGNNDLVGYRNIEYDMRTPEVDNTDNTTTPFNYYAHDGTGAYECIISKNKLIYSTDDIFNGRHFKDDGTEEKINSELQTAYIKALAREKHSIYKNNSYVDNDDEDRITITPSAPIRNDKGKPIIISASRDNDTITFFARDDYSDIKRYFISKEIKDSNYLEAAFGNNESSSVDNQGQEITQTATGMDPNLTYYIYVRDEKGNISTPKEVPALTLNEGVITFTPVQWDSTKHQGTTTISTSSNGKLEYAIVQGRLDPDTGLFVENNEEQRIYRLIGNGKETDLCNHNSVIYANLYTGDGETKRILATGLFRISDTDKPTVKIDTSENNKTTNSISFSVESSDDQSGMRDVDAPKYEIYYKEEGSNREERHITITGSGDNGHADCTIRGLIPETNYEIRVVATDRAGNIAGNDGDGGVKVVISTSRKRGSVEFRNLVWNQETHEASIKEFIGYSEDPTFRLQYSYDRTNWIPITDGGEIKNLKLDTIIYGRLTDSEGKNSVSKYATLLIKDKDKPVTMLKANEVTTNSITVEAKAYDREAGMPNGIVYGDYRQTEYNYRFFIKKKNDANSSYTLIQEGTNPICSKNGLENNTEYNVRVEITDFAGNKGTATIRALTGELRKGLVYFENQVWNPETHKATVDIYTRADGYQLQYSLDGSNWIDIENGGTVPEQVLYTIVYGRIFDGINKTDEISTFTIYDGIDPESPTFNISPASPTGRSLWYNTSEPIMITINDGVDYQSGVMKTTYTTAKYTSMNETEPDSAEKEVTADTQLQFNSEGMVRLTAYSYDYANNISKPGMYTIKRDTLPPSAPTYEFTQETGTPVDGWYTKREVGININRGIDDTSITPVVSGAEKINNITIFKDGNPYYNKDFTTLEQYLLGIDTDGIFEIRATTSDEAGNTSAESSFTFMKDSFGPYPPLFKINGEETNKWFNTPNVTVTITPQIDYDRETNNVSGYKNSRYTMVNNSPKNASDRIKIEETALEGVDVSTTLQNTTQKTIFQEGINHFTIEAFDNVGNKSMTSGADLKIDSKAPSAPTIGVSGTHNSDGVYTSDDVKISITPGIENTKITNDVSGVDRTIYSITDSNGTVVQQDSANSGVIKFGWSNNGTFTIKAKTIDKAGNISEDSADSQTTITIRRKIKITLNPNPGSGGTGAFWYYYGAGTFYSNEACTSTITSISKPSRNGYSFDNYSINNKAYIDSNGTIKSAIATEINNNATLYASWKANNYTVTYNANDGSGRTAISTHTYDVAKPLTANGFSRTGYTFNGWNTAANGSGTSYTNQQNVKNLATSGNVNLYAQWKINKYTVIIRKGAYVESFTVKIGTNSPVKYTSNYSTLYLDYNTSVDITCNYPSNSTSSTQFPPNPSVDQIHSITTTTYSFSKWTNSNNQAQTISTSNPLRLTINGSVDYTASVNRLVTTKKYQYTKPDTYIARAYLVNEDHKDDEHYDTPIPSATKEGSITASTAWETDKGKRVNIGNNATNVFRLNNDDVDTLAYWSEDVDIINFRFYSPDTGKMEDREWKKGHIINYGEVTGGSKLTRNTSNENTYGKFMAKYRNEGETELQYPDQGANGQGKYPKNTLYFVNGYQSVDRRLTRIKIFSENPEELLYTSKPFYEIWRGVYQIGEVGTFDGGGIWKLIQTTTSP